MSGTYTYPTEGSFKVINNKSGGTLSVTSSNSEIATASIDTNQTPPIVTVKPGTTAGEAEIIVKSAANGEYAESKAIHKATIENGKIELSAKAYTGDYDGEEHDAVYDVEVTPNDVKLKYTLKEGKEGKVVESDTIPKVTGANEYTIAIEASKEGYTTTSITKTVTIGKQTNTEGNLTLSANNGTLTYPTQGTFEITNNVSQGQLSVKSSNDNVVKAEINDKIVTLKPQVISTNGQTATITVTSAATDNYEEQTAKYEVIVNQGSITITATPYTGDYDGQEHDAVYDVKVTPNDAKLKYTLKQGKEGKVTESDEIPKVTGANEYTIAIEASKEGYMTTSVTHTVTVKKIDDEITLSESEATIIDFNDITFTATHIGDGKLSVKSNDTSVATASIDTSKNPPVVTVTPGSKAGTTTITVTSATTSNCNGASATYTITRSSQIIEAKKSGNYYNEQTELKDSYGNKVVVPKDFKVAKDSGDNITEGIVIEDRDVKTDGNNQQRGNQYVWIPVSNIDGSKNNPIIKSDEEKIEIALGRYEFADGTSTYQDNDGNNLGVLKKGEEIIRQYAKDYENPVTIQSSYQELVNYRKGNEQQDLTGENRTSKELGVFINSVEKNGGYYIARYEASYGTNKKANSKISTNYNESSEPTQTGTLWNNITQIKAAEACDSLYTTIQSDLVNSYAWDTAIVYIQNFSEDKDYSMQTSKNTTLSNTGQNEDEVCKINDMMSNCYEWTTEYCTFTRNPYRNPCVLRGGDYYYNTHFTSIRGSNTANCKRDYITFRPILYIK